MKWINSLMGCEVLSKLKWWSYHLLRFVQPFSIWLRVSRSALVPVGSLSNQPQSVCWLSRTTQPIDNRNEHRGTENQPVFLCQCECCLSPREAAPFQSDRLLSSGYEVCESVANSQSFKWSQRVSLVQYLLIWACHILKAWSKVGSLD